MLRGYVQLHNDPPIRRLISLCVPHGGISTCPSSPIYKTLCPLWQLAPYTAPLAFADYWKDPTDREAYLKHSRWLADLNNDRAEKVPQYRQHMLQLERYVLVEATSDTVVTPHVSESHGAFAWGSQGRMLNLRETDGYLEDSIGLRTLDEAGKLWLLTYEGDHLGFSEEFWSEQILPHLGP